MSEFDPQKSDNERLPDHLALDPLSERDYGPQKLDVPLEPGDRLAMGQELTACIMERDRIEHQRKTYNDECKAVASKQEERIIELAKQLHGGVKKADVQCVTIRDYRVGEVRTYRMDNQLELAKRPMSPEERQVGLKFGGADGAN